MYLHYLRFFSRLLTCSAAVCCLHSATFAQNSRGAAVEGTGEAGGKRWALLVGVNQYSDVEHLRYAERDVEQLERVLLAAGFDSDHIVRMTNSANHPSRQPFRSMLVRRLDTLLGRLSGDGSRLETSGEVQSGDVVVLAFAGHGIAIGDESFFCPADALTSEPDTLISLSDILRRLQLSEASAKVVLIDACRNQPRRGVRADPEDEADNDAVEFAKRLRQVPEGIVMMASCQVGQYSREDSTMGHGVFLKNVIDGLEGAADRSDGNGHSGNRNGRVSLRELYDFAENETAAYVERRFHAVQRPELILEGGDGVLDFEFPPYSAKLPFTSFFTVRVGNARGPTAAGADVSLRYRPTDEAPAAEIGRARTDDSGRAELTVGLSAAQRSGGLFSADIRHLGASMESELPGFLEQREWKLYAPMNSPLADRIRQLLADDKVSAALDLAWENWPDAGPDVRQIIAPHFAQSRMWWLTKAAESVANEPEPELRAAAEAALCLTVLKGGSRETAALWLKQALSSANKIRDAEIAVAASEQIFDLTSDTQDRTLIETAGRHLELTLQSLTMDDPGIIGYGQEDGKAHRRRRFHTMLTMAGVHQRVGSARANELLEKAYMLYKDSTDNFYWDLASYVRITALARGGNLAELKGLKAVTDGEIRIRALTGGRRFAPFGTPVITSEGRSESESGWTLRAAGEIARGGARFHDEALYRTYMRKAEVWLTAAQDRREQQSSCSHCREALICAELYSGNTDAALRRIESESQWLNADAIMQVNNLAAVQLAAENRLEEAWTRLIAIRPLPVISVTRVLAAAHVAVRAEPATAIDYVHELSSPAAVSAGMSGWSLVCSEQ